MCTVLLFPKSLTNILSHNNRVHLSPEIKSMQGKGAMRPYSNHELPESSWCDHGFQQPKHAARNRCEQGVFSVCLYRNPSRGHFSQPSSMSGASRVSVSTWFPLNVLCSKLKMMVLILAATAPNLLSFQRIIVHALLIS